jgi:phosphatidylserine/phosphatidylglycerophosphate/cardiolipin synthase-like enzyme
VPDPTDEWFLAGKDAVVSATRQIVTRRGNDVIGFIGVREYYQALARAIAATWGSGDFVYLAGWAFDKDTPLKPAITGKTTIGSLLEGRSAHGVAVRALIWAHPDGSNEGTVKWFGALPGGGAIHDDRVLTAGAHHQKIVIVKGPDGIVGFCGGMDIEAKRLGEGPHLSPWHDVQVQIKGSAAIDIWATFYDRWIEQASLAVGRSGVQRPVFPPAKPEGTPGTDLQVVRTFGNGAKHVGLNFEKAFSKLKVLTVPRQQSRTYQFAPTGERTIHRLLIKALRATKYSIYIEDQYLVCSEPIAGEPSLLAELAKTIRQPTFQGLVILTNGVGTVQGELHQTNYRRSRLWQQIDPAPMSPRLVPPHYWRGPPRASVWAYKSDANVYWMHSKTWIFDDTVAVVGSANCNRRGYCHDSELGAAIMGPTLAEGLPFPHDLRIRLWMKHLNALKQRVNYDQLIDFTKGMSYWADTPDTDLARLNLTRVDPSHPDESVAVPSQKKAHGVSWTSFFHGIAASMGTPKDWRDPEWDYLIDPDGS